MHDRVRSQHEELKQIAASFGREAEATARSLAQLRRQKDVLQGGDWLGQAARKFYDEMDGSLLPALTRLQRALTQSQQVTQRISARLRQAEADAAAVLKDREAFSGNAAFAGAGAGAGATAGSDGGGKGFWGQVGGFFKGVGLGAWDTVSGLWTAVTNPVDTLKGLAYAVTHPGELWDALKKPYTEAWARGDYGEAVGRGTFEVLSMLFPPGGGAAAKGAVKAADVAGDVARVANAASDVAHAADLAGDAARLAGQAADVARLDGAFTGARYIQGEMDTFAREGAQIYDQIVNTAGDTARIAEQTGLPQSLLDTVKQHFFVQEHNLPVGPNRMELANFTPDPHSGQLWQAAERGELTTGQAAQFNRWMAHEYVESQLMQAGLPYRSAHPSVVDNMMLPTREHFGAHDLAPLMDPARAPFAHFERLFPDLPQGLTLAEGLGNINDVVASIKKGLGL